MTVPVAQDIPPPPCAPPPVAPKRWPILRFCAWVASVLLLAAIVAPVVCIGGIYTEGPLKEEKIVIIPHGMSGTEAGDRLAKENAVYASFLFRIAARLVGPLRAGEYALPAKSSALQIATLIHEGHSIPRAFTAPEGLTSPEIVSLLNKVPVLTGSIEKTPVEGSLLPETYHYVYGDTRESLIARMQKAMAEKANRLWATRQQGLPIQSLDEALILASLIEKETGKPEERARIAGVFYNRLRKNMRLQSDPTVIYALTSGRSPMSHALTHADLSVSSPFNTYLNEGLPPNPICNPGAAALEAALHPEDNPYYYFVADGYGGHVFATDLTTHNKNINSWRQVLKSTPRP